MRSIERLEQQRRTKQLKKKNIPPPEEEMEEEMDLPKFIALNQKKNAFDDAADKTFGGINTQQSVFDRSATFRTSEDP